MIRNITRENMNKHSMYRKNNVQRYFSAKQKRPLQSGRKYNPVNIMKNLQLLIKAIIETRTSVRLENAQAFSIIITLEENVQVVGK